MLCCITKTHPAFSLTAPPACPWPKLPLCDERNPWNWKLHEVPTNFGPGQWDFSDLMACNRIRCHTCSFPCEISIFSNKAPWQSVISESFKYSNNAPTNLFICLSHLEVRIHQNFPVCQDTCRAGEWKSEGSDAQRTPDLFWVDPIQGCGSCPGGNKTHQYEYTQNVNQEKKK